MNAEKVKAILTEAVEQKNAGILDEAAVLKALAENGADITLNQLQTVLENPQMIEDIQDNDEAAADEMEELSDEELDKVSGGGLGLACYNACRKVGGSVEKCRCYCYWEEGSERDTCLKNVEIRERKAAKAEAAAQAELQAAISSAFSDTFISGGQF